MSSETRLEIASMEHMMKQPPALRYAVFCDPVLRGIQDMECETQTRMGHLGDYPNYQTARRDALAHPHSAVIRFYPDFETRRPAEDFLKDFVAKRH